jgi:hypothetical protein
MTVIMHHRNLLTYSDTLIYPFHRSVGITTRYTSTPITYSWLLAPFFRSLGRTINKSQSCNNILSLLRRKLILWCSRNSSRFLFLGPFLSDPLSSCFLPQSTSFKQGQYLLSVMQTFDVILKVQVALFGMIRFNYFISQLHHRIIP